MFIVSHEKLLKKNLPKRERLPEDDKRRGGGGLGGARLCASGHVAYGTRGREGRNGLMGCDAAGVTRVIARTKRPVDKAVGGGRRVGVGGRGEGQQALASRVAA